MDFSRFIPYCRGVRGVSFEALFADVALPTHRHLQGDPTKHRDRMRFRISPGLDKDEEATHMVFSPFPDGGVVCTHFGFKDCLAEAVLWVAKGVKSFSCDIHEYVHRRDRRLFVDIDGKVDDVDFDAALASVLEFLRSALPLIGRRLSDSGLRLRGPAIVLAKPLRARPDGKKKMSFHIHFPAMVVSYDVHCSVMMALGEKARGLSFEVDGRAVRSLSTCFSAKTPATPSDFEPALVPVAAIDSVTGDPFTAAQAGLTDVVSVLRATSIHPLPEPAPEDHGDPARERKAAIADLNLSEGGDGYVHSTWVKRGKEWVEKKQKVSNFIILAYMGRLDAEGRYLYRVSSDNCEYCISLPTKAVATPRDFMNAANECGRQHFWYGPAQLFLRLLSEIGGLYDPSSDRMMKTTSIGPHYGTVEAPLVVGGQELPLTDQLWVNSNGRYFHLRFIGGDIADVAVVDEDSTNLRYFPVTVGAHGRPVERVSFHDIRPDFSLRSYVQYYITELLRGYNLYSFMVLFAYMRMSAYSIFHRQRGQELPVVAIVARPERWKTKSLDMLGGIFGFVKLGKATEAAISEMVSANYGVCLILEDFGLTLRQEEVATAVGVIQDTIDGKTRQVVGKSGQARCGVGFTTNNFGFFRKLPDAFKSRCFPVPFDEEVPHSPEAIHKVRDFAINRIPYARGLFPDVMRIPMGNCVDEITEMIEGVPGLSTRQTLNTIVLYHHLGPLCRELLTEQQRDRVMRDLRAALVSMASGAVSVDPVRQLVPFFETVARRWNIQGNSRHDDSLGFHSIASRIFYAPGNSDVGICFTQHAQTVLDRAMGSDGVLVQMFDALSRVASPRPLVERRQCQMPHIGSVPVIDNAYRSMPDDQRPPHPIFFKVASNDWLSGRNINYSNKRCMVFFLGAIRDYLGSGQAALKPEEFLPFGEQLLDRRHWD